MNMQGRFVNNAVIFTFLLIALMLSNYVDASDLVVIPSWNDHQNGSYPCNLYENLQNLTVFTGDNFQTCELKLISSNQTAALLRLFQETSRDSFLYAERQGDLLNCQNRFSVITDTGTCSIVFWHLEIRFFLQGNTSILISEIPVDPRAFPWSNQIDDHKEVNPAVSQIEYCHIKEYNHSVSCSWFLDNCCIFYDFPYNCNASLNDIEVVFQCYDSDSHSNYTALLIYPADVVSLELMAQNIVRINGSPFRRLQRLKELVLGWNKLSSVDQETFQDLTTLTSLDLKGNRLVTLHINLFTKLNMLQILYLNDNDINDLQLGVFRNLTSLRFLSLARNHLVTLHVELFTTLNMLETLYLDRNNINNLQLGHFRNLISLKKLFLDRNKLRILHQDLFANVTTLSHLGFGRNRLVSVASDLFKDLFNLVHLELDNNQIISLGTNVFNRTSKLGYLLISNNNLTVVPKALFQRLKKLKYLFLENNNIAALDVDSFSETPSLIVLHLSFNALTYLQSGLFNGMTNLKFLYLNHNEITSLGDKLFIDNSNLIWLSLDKNNISVLPHGSFEGLTRLNLVHLNQNQITSLPSGILKNTTNVNRLDISKNDLSIIPNGLLQGLGKLRHLDLHTNQLVNLDSDMFYETKSLAFLYLYDNKLSVLPGGLFQELTSLIVLSLHTNELTNLPSDIFDGLTSLESLFLQDNYITTIGYQTFHGLQSLRHLNLSHAYIRSLHFDLFQDTEQLELLDMSYNKLEEIPNINNLMQLTFLNLQDNLLIKITNKTFSTIFRGVFIIVRQPEFCHCYVSANTSCNALDDISPYLTCSRLLSDRILMVMMWLVGLNALCGNIFVLSYYKYVKRDKNPIQTFLLSNLAISDLLMGIYMLFIASADIYFGESFPIQAERWRAGISCKIAGTISIVSSEASVFFLTLISIDRCINIKHPFSDRKLRKKSSTVFASILWFTSLVLGIVPSSLGGNRKYRAFYDNSHVCIGLPLALIKTYAITIDKQSIFTGRFWYEKKLVESEYLGEVSGMYFASAMFLGLNCICFLIILACYVEIVRAVFKSSKRAGINKDMNEEIRMTLNVSVVVLTDFVCWFPIIIVGILVQIKVVTLPPSVFAWCVTFILPVNSAINPYLYTIAHVITNYRKEKLQKENACPKIQR